MQKRGETVEVEGGNCNICQIERRTTSWRSAHLHYGHARLAATCAWGAWRGARGGAAVPAILPPRRRRHVLLAVWPECDGGAGGAWRRRCILVPRADQEWCVSKPHDRQLTAQPSATHTCAGTRLRVYRAQRTAPARSRSRCAARSEIAMCARRVAGATLWSRCTGSSAGGAGSTVDAYKAIRARPYARTR